MHGVCLLIQQKTRSTVERGVFALHQSMKVLVKLFQKLDGVWGEQPHSYRSKNAGVGEFLCNAKEEGEPSSGVLPNNVIIDYMLLTIPPPRHLLPLEKARIYDTSNNSFKQSFILKLTHRVRYHPYTRCMLYNKHTQNRSKHYLFSQNALCDFMIYAKIKQYHL